MTDPLLAEERRSENDDSADDCPDDPPLPELPDRDEPLSELLERDEALGEDPDELCWELLNSELLGELFEEHCEESLELNRALGPSLEDWRLLDPELRELLLGLLFDELCSELETLLPDESLDERDDEGDDNRDDSLTPENDLLDP